MHPAPTVVRGTTPIVALLTAVAATLALTPPPASAWGVDDPATLAPSGAAVTLSADGTGNAAAAWVSGGQVLVSRRPARSRTWTSAVAVSPAGETASAPDVSVGPGGDVAVVWSATPPGGTSDVKIAVEPAGGSWVPARNVSEAPLWQDTDAQVDVGPAGIATVVWAARQTTTTSAAVRSKAASATSVGNQSALSVAEGTFSGVSLARNAVGDTVAAWRHLDAAGTPDAVQAARRLAGTAWSPPVSQGLVAGVLDTPSAVVDGAGNASVGWSSGSGPDTSAPYVFTWPRGGAPSAPSGLASAPGRGLVLSATASGQVGAAWLTGTGATYADLGGAPQPLVSGVAVSGLSLALSETGAATASWTVAGGGLGLGHRPAASTWTAQSVTAAPDARSVVVAHGGDATLAWTDGDGGPVRARTLDDAAPTAVHLTAPMRPLNVGTRIRAGWIGDDVWSPITYEVQRQVTRYDGHAGAAEVWKRLTATDAAYDAEAGQTVCLKVRGFDRAGNTSPWSVARCATTPVNDRTLEAKGFTARKGKGYFSGDYATSRRRGASLVLPGVTARRVALLVGVGGGHGTVTVSLGKKRLGTYSLAARSRDKQVVVPVANFGSARSGRLTVTVTSRGRPVVIDGVYAGP